MCDDSGVGGDGRSVGRTYPAFENAPNPQLLPMGAAQCANNSAYGSWYSLEPAGRCASPLPSLERPDLGCLERLALAYIDTPI